MALNKKQLQTMVNNLEHDLYGISRAWESPYMIGLQSQLAREALIQFLGQLDNRFKKFRTWESDVRDMGPIIGITKRR